MQSVSKSQQSFITELDEMILHFTQKCKEVRMVKKSWKKNNKVKGLTAHDFRNYSKAVFIIRFLTEKSLLAPMWISGILSGVHKYQIKYLRSCWGSLTTLSRGGCFPTKSLQPLFHIQLVSPILHNTSRTQGSQQHFSKCTLNSTDHRLLWQKKLTSHTTQNIFANKFPTVFAIQQPCT